MGGDLVRGRRPPDRRGAGQRPGAGARAPRARRGAAAGDVHARLRHHELLRRRLRGRRHAQPAAHHGAPRQGARRQAGARGLRHRPGLAREQACRRGPHRRHAAVPALPRHPATARRPTRAPWLAMVDLLPAGAQWAAFAISGAWRCPSSPRRCCSAATCAWVWRTTSTCAAACSRATRSWSSTPSASSRALGARPLPPAEAREKLGLRAGREPAAGRRGRLTAGAAASPPLPPPRSAFPAAGPRPLPGRRPHASAALARHARTGVEWLPRRPTGPASDSKEGARCS